MFCEYQKVWKNTRFAVVSCESLKFLLALCSTGLWEAVKAEEYLSKAATL